MKRLTLLLLSILFSTSLIAQTKSRLFVLTDIENEPDDAESMVRLLVYSNVIDIEGIAATTSTHMRDGIHPETILKEIDAYGKVRANLLKHEQGYPTAESLKQIVYKGQPKYGMSCVGKGKDSEGSNALVKAIEKDDSRPLWISAWGGINTLAQALYTLKDKTGKKELSRLLSRIRVYSISDQDDAGIWIRRNFPDIFYIVSPGGYGNATWGGINDTSSPLANNEVVCTQWIYDNIQQGHGALGACYPDVAYGMEGDTPSWLGLVPNGLNDYEHPNYGGWGGRYEFYKPDIRQCDFGGFNGNVPMDEEPHAIWTNAIDRYYPYRYNPYGKALWRSDSSVTNFKCTIWRWREDFQNDFAARMDWCTMDYANANHPPVPVLASPESITVKSGEVFKLDASDSYDPDGDNLSYLWFNYVEAGTMTEEVHTLGSENIHFVYFKAPEVSKTETLHFILKLTDKGSPRLTRYKRVIVTVTK